MRWMSLFALAPLAGCYVTSDKLTEKILSQVDSDGDGFRDQDFDGADCDDENPDIHPGADEVCDGIDNNCDGTVDEDDAIDALTWYADTDGDGYGDNDTAVKACDAPAGHVADSTDCDDAEAEIHPAATEICDGTDNDCDGTVDEDDAIDALTWYADTDGDGYGDAGTLFVSCDAPTGYLADGTDCDDGKVDVNPDADEDCDGIDNNCDGEIDENDATDALTWYADTDGDGYGDASDSMTACQAPTAHVADNTDCDDTDSAVNSGGTETCNGADDDCDGTVDENDATNAYTWYADTDGDGFGNPATSTVACNQPANHVSDNQDCDDSNNSIHPAASENCLTIGIDDDCDGLADDDDSNPLNQSLWYADNDGDGYGHPSSFQSACIAPSGTVSDNTDCDDTNYTSYPGASEYCDGTDNDCDGTTDGSNALDATTWYLDADGDGDGGPSTTSACSMPSGYSNNYWDCDDSDAGINMGAQEICDLANIDEDCDGLVNDDDSSVTGGTGSWVPDADGDGYGSNSVPPTALCDTSGSGWTSDTSDCDDSDPLVNPDAWESLGDSTDSDCDGDTDNLQWTTLSNHLPGGGGLKGIRMTAWGDTIYTSWAADGVQSPTGGTLTNTLVTRVSDASDPLVTSAELFSTSSFNQVDFHDAFDVIADGNYLYWAQSNTLSDFGSGTSGVAFHTILQTNPYTINPGANVIISGATSSTPAQDVSLYYYETGGTGTLQAAICSTNFTTSFIRGSASNFQTFSGISNWGTDNLGIDLPAGNNCDSFHYLSGSLSASLLMVSNYNPGGTGEDYWEYKVFPNTNDLYDWATYTLSLLDMSNTNLHGWLAAAYSYDETTPSLGVSVRPSSGTNYSYTYGTIVDRIEQLDVVASPSGQVAVCGITETGGARLYLMDPQNNTTQIDTYPLDPLGTSYDECAITSGISGMLVVTLLSGTTISQGAIEIP